MRYKFLKHLVNARWREKLASILRDVGHIVRDLTATVIPPLSTVYKFSVTHTHTCIRIASFGGTSLWKEFRTLVAKAVSGRRC